MFSSPARGPVTPAPGSGRAHFFRVGEGSVPSFFASVAPTDSSSGEQPSFGTAVAIDGDVALVGNPLRGKGLEPGQIIYVGTDGIWETIDSAGKRFGKAPIKELIRQNAAASAQEILNAILTALNRFRQGLEPEDDVTMVVIKITEDR